MVVVAAVLFSGCSLWRGGGPADVERPLEDFTGIPEVPLASAPGVDVVENRKAVIDFSNKGDGYVMVRYHGDSARQIRALLTDPGGSGYVFRLEPGGGYGVLPLTGGDGEYTVDVLEEVEDQLYALVITVTFAVELYDEFAVFLRPNQYVDYSRGSAVVRKAAELTEGLVDELEKIAAIYNFVIANIVYDDDLAVSVESGYLPDVDSVMERGKGICFDFAALMTAMLRSQGIPARMVLGYTGDAYHAWVSVHAGGPGWVDGLIFFDGSDWMIMDPTFTAGGLNSDILGYISDASNYNALYLY